MNPDGTIAGAPGLNLTDGNGRIIPVNLSVSIPVLSSAQVREEDQQKEQTRESSNHPAMNNMYHNAPSSSVSHVSKAGNSVSMMNEDSGQITPRQTTSSKIYLKTLAIYRSSDTQRIYHNTDHLARVVQKFIVKHSSQNIAA